MQNTLNPVLQQHGDAMPVAPALCTIGRSEPLHLILCHAV